MKVTILLTLFLVSLFSVSVSAQTESRHYPDKSIIIHKTEGFTRDASKLWIDTKRHRKQYGLSDYDPELFLTWKIDKSDVRKSAAGYEYYHTNLLFGFKDQDEFYELPYTFYAGTGNKLYAHALAYDNKAFYILAYDLVDAKKVNRVLFKFSKEKGLQNYIFTDDPQGHFYPDLSTKSGSDDWAVELSYYNKTESRIEEFYISDKFLNVNGEIDAKRRTLTSKELELNPLKTPKELAEFSYENSSNPGYDHKDYVLSKNIILAESEVSQTLEKQDVRKYPASLLKEGEKDGWKNLKDWYNRDTSTLFFQYKTNLSDYKTDSKNRKYYKTQLRFGFRDDPRFYELPESFYLLFNEEMEYAFYGKGSSDVEFNSGRISGVVNAFGSKGSSDVEFNPPCLLFTDETFYIFISNYTGQDKQEGTLFTYYLNKGLVKEVLWSGDNENFGWFPYFTDDEESGFALVHINNQYKNRYKNILKTYRKNNRWLTRHIDLAVGYPELLSNYKKIIKPHILLPKPEPYEKPLFNREKYNVLAEATVFTNSEKDRKRLGELSRLKSLPTELRLFRDIPRAEYKYYKFYFSNIEIEKRTELVELPHRKLEIPYMPEVKDQAVFESCLSYAYGAMYKQFIDSDWQITELRQKDPTALKRETDISYFGMQQYFRGNKSGVDSANLWMYDGGAKKEVQEAAKKRIPEFNFEYLDGKYSFNEPFEIVLQNENNLDAIPSLADAYFSENPGQTEPLPPKTLKVIFRSYIRRIKISRRTTAGMQRK